MVTKAVPSVCSEDARPGEAHTQACVSGALTSQPHLLICRFSRERLGIQSPQEAAGHDQTSTTGSMFHGFTLVVPFDFFCA